jgi:hypothetical protein
VAGIADPHMVRYLAPRRCRDRLSRLPRAGSNTERHAGTARRNQLRALATHRPPGRIARYRRGALLLTNAPASQTRPS